MVNTALAYELAALRHHAEPLLEDIQPEQPEYVEAKRLRKFLKYIIPVSADGVPPNSIMREFIGGSCFHPPKP